MTQTTGAFKVMNWEEKPYDCAGDQPALMQASATYEMLGDIEGEASVCYLMGYGTNGIASYVGLARVTGKVGERDGNFVMQDVGAFENGVASGRWTILPGLAGGDLIGIAGEGGYSAGPTEVSYSLELSF